MKAPPRPPSGERNASPSRRIAPLATLAALVCGVALGGWFPGELRSVADAARAALSVLVLVAPLLIVGALSPAIATLVRRGLAGKFVFAVVGWFVAMSTAGSLLGMLVAGITFRLGYASPGASVTHPTAMLRGLAPGGHASAVVVAIVLSVGLGLVGVRVDSVYALLGHVQRAIAWLGGRIDYALIAFMLVLGIMLGVGFGARLGMQHYGTVIAYAALMAIIWLAFYLFVLLPLVGRVRVDRRIIREYYYPTALFAAGTCSSLATIPVNIANLKRIGVREEVADFVVPIGAVMHKGASAMQYMAYGPLIAGSFFGYHIGWAQLLAVWPVIVLYTMAAPGVPGAMGLSLWTGVLFASLLGLHGPVQSTFVGTWVALTGGVPDMLRSQGNATADGLSALLLAERFFDPAKRT